MRPKPLARQNPANARLVQEQAYHLPQVAHCYIRLASAPHEPRWSVPSTVRLLNEPKISHFDQLGCSRIGRKTAKEFHCDAVLYGAAEPIGESFSHCVLASLAKQRSIPFR